MAQTSATVHFLKYPQIYYTDKIGLPQIYYIDKSGSSNIIINSNPIFIMNPIDLFEVLLDVDFKKQYIVLKKPSNDIVPSDWISKDDIVIRKPREWNMNGESIIVDNRRHLIENINNFLIKDL